MRLNVALLAWLVRRTLPVTMVAAMAYATLALLIPARLQPRFIGDWAWLVVLVPLHAVLVVWLQARPLGGPAGWLYTRGFSRDRLWAHQVLASAAAVLMAWLAGALVVWTPLRGWVQEAMGNPFYPGAAWLERGFPLRVLPLYGLLLPVLHYGWMRLGMPTRERSAGLVVPAVVLVWLLPMGGLGLTGTLSVWLTIPLVLAALGLAVLSVRLHRTTEVGP